MKNKSIFLISIGILNLLHGLTHIIQFIQSIFLISYSLEEHHHDHSLIDQILHNPILSFVWAIIGIVSLVIGIRDYRHHKNCKHEH
jgi:hypothetical protein